jgi:transposase InsO family protein
MESFFDTFKAERVHYRVYATRDQARRDLFGYLEGFYNPRRFRALLATDLVLSGRPRQA